METTNVLERVENEMQHVEDIRSRLFTVYDVQVPAPAKYLQNLGLREEIEVEIPDTKIIYNSNGKFLGHVGRIYESIQPSAFLDSLVGTIEGCENNLDLSKLEYRSLKDGKAIEFRLPTEIIGFKNSRGKDDGSELFINFTTGFGGFQRSEIGLYAKRLICTNGMKIIQSETELKVKHTAKMNAKVMLYCEELSKTVARVQETTKLWKQMDSKQVDSETTERFARLIAGVKKEETVETMSTKKRNILDKVNEAIAQEFERTGTTVWGLLNGATNYTNHFASGSDNEEYILVDTGAKINALAQREAIALLN